ncbi:uncharacterized protein L3040_000262 [Drepanopeziza brunnea f. sp. 'multigermtubi']|uniref:Sentrin/SUMO-specific protease n=1 Tax=Marssonina brunnea f. sp. multigermtubi (strain MB_m1) TaxID=1072389 RepID=K1WUI2_MARBU|nr:sentrin/SUMO-specific protease [Drepanopeziza brunnea f. sp. 'multigermtubi' MB_m1]EKD12268.1 sentrin/SUMO-specific protease [Drepanopeziza brunnea f. sp. 'multigermtubi' MB_m1]KAJ5053973.1 hypothetical protein L3040_000262 [Drepanopeziza brunnea f. sp. 'multigermtubi']
MASIKRKASEEINRCSVTYIEPVQVQQPTTNNSPGALSRLWSWTLGLFTTICAVVTYTNMGYKLEDVVAEDHIQKSTERSDGNITEKRLKTRRSKSHPELQGCTTGPINLEGCHSEIEIKQRVDSYWTPPPLGFNKTKMNKSAARRPRTPTDSSPGSSGLDIPFEKINLHHPENTLPTPNPSPSAQGSAEEGKRGISAEGAAQNTADITPLPQSTVRKSKSQGSLVDRLRDILVEEEEDEPIFQASTYKKVELKVLREEREKKRKDAARKAAKERRLRRQNPLKPLIAPLGPKWEDMVNEVIYSNDTGRAFTTSREGNPLRKHDFMTLLGNCEWLNDEIINTYVEWVADAANAAAIAEDEANGEPASTVPKVFAHNSFFYKTLEEKGPAQSDRLMKRKKIPGVSLLEVETVLIPINKGSHWTLGIVRPVARTIEYLDSMGGKGPNIIQHLQGWVKHMLGKKYVRSEWKTPRTSCAYQSNGFDCGVFLCTNAFCVALGLNPNCYRETDLVQQRKNIAAVLLNQGFKGEFSWNSEGFLS